MDSNAAVMLKVMRDGKMQDVSVTLGQFPTQQERASVDNGNSDKSLGVAVENLTPDTAQELKLPAATKGVVVDQVDPASRAAEAGLQPGDVIQQVNRQSVTNVKDFNQAVSSLPKDGPVLLLVDRHGNTIFLAA